MTGSLEQDEFDKLEKMKISLITSTRKWFDLHGKVTETAINHSNAMCATNCDKDNVENKDKNLMAACKRGCALGKKIDGGQLSDADKGTVMAELTGLYGKEDEFSKLFMELNDEITSPQTYHTIDEMVKVDNIDNAATQVAELKTRWEMAFSSLCSTGESMQKFKSPKRCHGFWQGKDNRSGYRDDVANASGSRKYALANIEEVDRSGFFEISEYGCKVEIPRTISGYCECADGDPPDINAADSENRRYYADGGHLPFTCEKLCHETNKEKGKDKGRTLIYEDPKNWLRFTGPPGDQLICSKKETNKVSGSAGGREETYGPVPTCPAGTKSNGTTYTKGKDQILSKTGTVCQGSYFNGAFNCWGGEYVERKISEHQGTMRCAVCKPYDDNYDKATNVGFDTGRLDHMAVDAKLKEECTNVGKKYYTNIYLDLLELKLAGVIVDAKVKILNNATIKYKKTFTVLKADRKASLTILENYLRDYQQEYSKYHRRRDDEKKNTVAAILEDITLKGKSINISYFIWLTLAIFCIGFAIKRLKS